MKVDDKRVDHVVELLRDRLSAGHASRSDEPVLRGYVVASLICDDCGFVDSMSMRCATNDPELNLLVDEILGRVAYADQREMRHATEASHRYRGAS